MAERDVLLAEVGAAFGLLGLLLVFLPLLLEAVRQGQGGAVSAAERETFSGNKATVKDVHPKQRAPEIGDYVRQRIASGSTQAPAAAAPQAAPSPPTESPMEQLKKLAELRDAGIVSDEEFEAKKAELLSRM